MKKIPTLFLRDPANPKIVTEKPHPDCDWVFRGEGVATRKLDGTACLWTGGRLWKRREVFLTRLTGEELQKAMAPGTEVSLVADVRGPKPFSEALALRAPPGWVAAQFHPEGPDKKGRYKTPGWIPVGDGPEDRWHREARVAVAWDLDLFPLHPEFESDTNHHEEGLTMELVGPKINGNPERVESHLLFYHAGLWLTGSKDRFTILPCLKQPAERELGSLRDFLEKNPMEGLVFHHGDGRMGKVKRKDLGLPWPVKP